ncbi:hypothetical protein JAAARDRAFT_35805 [Jaapia argillacea MUCL 33604]|uniref:Sodium/calcium exchanger membrane region domain-containing protein n=1 Tax=Jaapia argillacea MUCL 33604 TaxID=933084 RepID=A0A067PQV5_9AGAM|nr:hypothetical protein JAAARDRAFT_35805 [Jaapia argillacea MUCL 33604]
MVSPASARLVLASLFVINCILWSHSRYAHVPPADSSARWKAVGGLSSVHSLGHPLFGKRSLGNVTGNIIALTDDGEETECLPLLYPPDQQCAHVKDVCPDSDTFLSIQYIQSYFCAQPSARPFTFVGLIVWLIFLFSTLGISASDFFCPNLATIAQLMGLDESVAGVTLLAFGNGSPDVFSTYSAMRADSGSLAVGELLGAASFIVSCVVGSMCIIKPFQVGRYPFLRDVGFFTFAVALLIFILHDGRIWAWESALLVAMYIVYANVVVLGTWWETRREKKRRTEATIRGEYGEDDIPSILYHDEEPYRDEPSPVVSHTNSSLTVPSSVGTRPRAISHPGPPRLGLQTNLPPRPHSRSPSPSSRPGQMPSFSLIGALEFRQVVSSLQQQAAGTTLSMFESPVTPYVGGHYFNHSRSLSRTPSATTPLIERDLWDTSLVVPANHRPTFEELHVEGPDTPPIPLISHTPASPASEDDTESQTIVPPTRRQRVFKILRITYRILFPTLHHFKSKSFLGKVASLFAAPAVMALTITLPVIVTPYDIGSIHVEKGTGSESRLIDFEEEGIERTLIAEEEVEEQMHPLEFNKWLMAAQCVFGPLFCVNVLFHGMGGEGWILLAVGTTGLAAGALVAVFANKGEHPTARVVRCSMGFFVAIVWIMAIADEVVNVLLTFGFIFGLSDAIIGLTIFAMGNSLADLVANMSVAVFAPIMGFSACFGGPMLNMLLGVGISGSYIIHQRQGPYDLQFSTTLLTSSVGLLALLVLTLIFVPLNGFYLTRRWGIFLIFAYSVMMAINIIVETKS